MHQQQPPQQQKARRTPAPSLELASAIDVESLDTGPRNALREGKSVWLIMKMAEKNKVEIEDLDESDLAEE